MALANWMMLGDFHRDAAIVGPQAAGTLWQPSAAAGDAEIGTDEVAEIAAIEAVSPVAAGVPEDLDSLYLVIDGQSTQNILNMSGRDDISTNPVRTHVIASDPHRFFIVLGESIVKSLSMPIPALANTTLKMNDRVTVIARAGATDVTENYRIRLWGYLYNDRLLSRLPQPTMPGSFDINDTRRQRTIHVPFPAVEITRQNWSLLPGGVDQEPPKIMPFMRFATNSNATVANTRYGFRFDLGNVDDQFKDLEFEYDLQNRVFIAKALGARAHANSRHAWIHIPGDPISEEMPPGRFPVFENRNPIIFGRGTPQWPADQPVYYALPKFGVTDHVIYRERAVVSIQDNGTPIPVNGMAVAIFGKRIDLGGKV